MNERPDKVTEIMNYIRKDYSISRDAQRMLEASLQKYFSIVINPISSSVIRAMLEELGMLNWEINAILQGDVPSSTKLRYPVTVAVKRYYRIYVDAPEDATDSDILDMAHKMVISDSSILENAEDPETIIEDDDVEALEVDNAGAQEV